MDSSPEGLLMALRKIERLRVRRNLKKPAACLQITGLIESTPESYGFATFHCPKMPLILFKRIIV